MFQQSFRILYVCMIAVLAGSTAVAAQTTRILGGQEISVRQAPFVVQLRDAGGFFCGGALVSSRFVVTAAHCLEGTKLEDITVVAAATTIHETGVQSQVEDGWMPSEYDTDVMDMDVAVLLLRTEIKGGVIENVPLCTTPMQPGDLIQIYGWGRTTENGRISEQLRTVPVPIIEKEVCVLKYKRLAEKLTDSMMCAYEAGKDACTSDSGGPAIFNGELCGIVSWSKGCGHPQAPGVYTNVNEIKWFIEQVMAGDI